MSDEVKRIIMPGENEASAVIVKHRQARTYKRSIILEPRYWVHKETGLMVECQDFLLDVDNNCLIVRFQEQDTGIKRSMPLKSRPHPFFANTIEKGFEDDYTPHGNSSNKF